MSNQAKPQWVALWRHKDPLTLLEAAAWLCGLEPGITYNHRDASDRRERDRRDAMLARLVDAVKAGALHADLTRWHQAARTHENWVTREVKLTPAQDGTDYKGSKVARADLAAWAQANSLSPDPFPVTSGNAADTGGDTVTTNTKPDSLVYLNQAWTKFWGNADHSDKATWPKTDAVVSWLEKEGLSNRQAKAGASIIRPKWATSGRLPNG